MATLDLSKAKQPVDMTDPNLVSFATAGARFASDWYYLTPPGSSVHAHGSGMTFDANGHALTGAVDSIELDVGAYDANNPDVKITGLNIPAAQLDDGPASFWRILEGNDVIIGPSAANAGPGVTFTLFGDAPAARPGSTTGGNDVIESGSASSFIYGDVEEVGSQIAGSPQAGYKCGSDDILGYATTEFQAFAGDANIVNASGLLRGGNDTIFIQSTFVGSGAVGDVTFVKGVAGDIGELVGGDDYISAGPDFRGSLTGDAASQGANTLVRGGKDRIDGGNVRDHIYGDVQYVSGGQLIGGDDRLRGNGGDDYISGDAERVEAGGKLTGGNDTLYGAAGNDRIDGEAGFFESPTSIAGGNDLIFGEAGNDALSGQTGNDQLYGGADADELVGGVGNDFLDGGQGADKLEGGSGNDNYVVDDMADRPLEQTGGGTDTILSILNSHVLGANFENLTSLASGEFIGIGNELANTIQTGAGKDAIGGRAGNDRLFSGTGDDQLHGEAGNDVLNGGAGGDRMEGGDGFDMISYAGADQTVRMALDGSLAAAGDAIGDSVLGVEGLEGSGFGDVLRGDGQANVLLGNAGSDNLQGMAGNDLIEGGAGSDFLVGGLGNDRFRFTALTQGIDRIADFTNAAGNNDVLNFEGDAFGGLAAGSLAANRFTANAAGVATTLAQRFVYETDTGLLRYDANGSAAGGVTAIAVLTGAPALTAADLFIL